MFQLRRAYMYCCCSLHYNVIHNPQANIFIILPLQLNMSISVKSTLILSFLFYLLSLLGNISFLNGHKHIQTQISKECSFAYLMHYASYFTRSYFAKHTHIQQQKNTFMKIVIEIYRFIRFFIFDWLLSKKSPDNITNWSFFNLFSNHKVGLKLRYIKI